MSEKKEEKKKRLSKASLKQAMRIFKYVKPYRWQFAFGIVLISLSGVFTLLVTRLWGQLGGVGVQQPEQDDIRSYFDFEFNFSDLGSLAVIIFAVLVIQAIMSFTRVILFARITENMMLALRKDTYQKIIRMPMQYFNEQRVGDLNSRISADITSIQDVFTTTLAELLRQLIVIVGGIAALLFFSPTLTFIMLSTLPVVIIIAVIFGRFIRKLSKKTQDQVAESNVVVQETLTGIVNVKSFANELLEVTRYMGNITEIKKFALKGAWWRASFSSFIILFIFGAISLVIFKGADLMATGELDSEYFFSFLLMTGLVAGSIGGIAAQFAQLQRGIGAIENVMDILELDPEPVVIESPNFKQQPLKGEIEFQGLQFHYDSRKEIQVINNLSFRASAGDHVAIVGPSGAGKSTIASLILQFYLPKAGKVQFDGIDASEYDLTELRSQMAFVPQEVILFGGSIKENIAYGNPEASDEEIHQAAAQANALQFIDQFPDGMDTIVGERGIQLSGGQRQRIAIARAVLKNPTILILDEATSSLDSESERLVQDALDKLMKGRTSVVIAHRLSTIRSADKIIVLDGGKKVEEGKHEELITIEKGVYRGLVELQSQLVS
ncbi:ABC transporter ATP-binding protein [Sanyastnella coralliicola]|uniref:ABC transporter ATP-binding protein n=1 Tax=Sanyastnella coralliicola TaxID=3069118 RepID=UPI0027B8A118|nr:ABC transporter transmembrane domain-containing protein [Longitalea sp. SCSIO 12813]